MGFSTRAGGCLCYNGRGLLEVAISDHFMNRDRCRSLRKEGCSIGEIARTLQLSESTVHWHVRDISLTQGQRDHIRERWRRVMVLVNAKRRGRPLKCVSFLKPAWSKELVHLISHLTFDGRIDRYGCYYYSREYSQAFHVQRLLHRLLRVVAPIRRRADNGIWIVSFHHVQVAAWLAEREAELLSVLQAKNRPAWWRQWLQALFDDEGHVHVAGAIRRVRASQDNTTVLHRAKESLQTLGIQSRIDTHARAVEITGQENLARFSRCINFSPGIHVNPRRKNGLWNKAFEKRELLAVALQSYVH